MAAKRKASALNTAVDDEPVDPSDELAFYCLGGGNEVGRSCHIIQYKGKTVMVCDNEPPRSSELRKTDWLVQLDAGMHPAKEGFSALPFFDEFDLSTVDILLISQYVEYTLPLLQALAHNHTGPSREATRTARSLVVINGGILYLRDTGPMSLHVHHNRNNRLFLRHPVSCFVSVLLDALSTATHTLWTLGLHFQL